MIDSNCIITRDFAPLVFAKIVLVTTKKFHYTITNSYFDSFIIGTIIGNLFLSIEKFCGSILITTQTKYTVKEL